LAGLLQRAQVVLGERLAVGVARDQGLDAGPDLADEAQIAGQVQTRLLWAGRCVDQPGIGQPRTCFLGLSEHVRAQVQVQGIDERLYEQQRRRCQLVLEM
jgi:hypothetical protein